MALAGIEDCGALAPKKASEGIHRLLVERKRRRTERGRRIVYDHQEHPKSLHLLCLINRSITDVSVVFGLFIGKISLPLSLEVFIIVIVLGDC